ncbi:MAG TPA: CHASE3 domain-containing protein [Vicinamibacterales bacterium]|nr:CHASE3 domain-containing protein [Vicinamibacterales bacterium]
MFRHWTFGRKVGVGFALGGLILGVIALVGYVSADQLIASDRLVAHTYLVRQDLSDLVSQLKDAETGQRGYVITGNDTFLQPYQSALGEIRTRFEDIRRLTVDNADQQRRLDSVSPLIDSKLAELKETIDLRRTAGFEPTAKIVAAGRGKDIMDQIRAVAGQMDREEQDLLAQRNQRAEANVRTTKAILIGGSLVGVLLVALVGWLITTSLSTQVGAAVQHVQSSSAELQTAANQQATGAKEQSTAMNEISTTISELLVTTRQIAESAQRVAQIAEETAAGARSGGGTVAKARESISAIRRQVDLVVNHMLELGTKSQQIGAVLEIVSELAEQTNILAINATIEAAGAGEAGQRFAVVADEIRKLADRVGGSTKEIRTLIDDVRSAVNTTVMATETGSKSVDAGSKHFDEVAAAFQHIAGLVTTTTEAAREIGLSTKQQATAVEQVNVAISNVAQTTRETEASSGQTLQTASQLSFLSKDLLRLVQPHAA